LDPASDPWLTALLPNARNLVVTPLSADSGAIGVFVAEHSLRSGSRIERRVVSTVELFVSHAALAIRGAWLLVQMQRMAATGALTGIANRMRFQEALEQELARASRGGEDVTLMMLDIDHFKQLND